MRLHCKCIILFFSLSWGFIATSCNQPHHQEVIVNPKTNTPVFDTTSFKTGIVINKVKCLSDTTHTYSLYLPEHYNKNQQWPVIYFFDSHAAGNLPVEKYKALAEKYGYIIAGSNNSKNGLGQEAYNDIIQKFMYEVSQRFSIDTKRIYTAGFSGGARIAVTAAMIHTDIVGVIGCGAGFPNTNEPLQRSFEFIGIVGNADFNYAELNKLDQALEENGTPHQLIVFKGKHEWPAETIMEQAYWWIACNAMRKNCMQPDLSIIQLTEQFLKYELAKAEKEYNTSSVYYVCKTAFSYLRDLSDVGPYAKKLELLETSGKIQQLLQHKASLEKSEILLQQQYAAAFTNHDWVWWSKEIDNIYRISRAGVNAEEAIIHKRLLSYLSLVAYMYSSKALQVDQLENAELFLKIYEKVDTGNSEYAFLFAQLYMKQNNPKKAMCYLKKAVDLGFNDKERLSTDPLFVSLKWQAIFD